MKLLLPGRRFGRRVLQLAGERRRARVAALHPRLREDPREQRVDRDAQQLQRGRALRQHHPLRDRLLRHARTQRTLVDPRGQLPGALTLVPEAVEQRVHLLPGDIAQRVQTEPVQVLQQLRPHDRRGQQVDRVRREERRRIAIDPAQARRAPGLGRDERSELVRPDPDPRLEVHRDGLGERVEHRPLAAVHLLQAVQPHVGHTQLRPLDPVADVVQPAQQPLELARVVRLVRLQDDGLGLQRERLLQRHPRLGLGGRRQAVNHDRSSARALHDQPRRAPQLRPPRQLHAGAKVGDQQAGDGRRLGHVRWAFQKVGRSSYRTLVLLPSGNNALP